MHTTKREKISLSVPCYELQLTIIYGLKRHCDWYDSGMNVIEIKSYLTKIKPIPGTIIGPQTYVQQVSKYKEEPTSLILLSGYHIKPTLTDLLYAYEASPVVDGNESIDPLLVKEQRLQNTKP